MNRTSEAGREKMILELVALDFNLAPYSLIREQLQINPKTIAEYRRSEMYLESMKELQEEFRAEMLRTPQTTELKKTITHAMAVAVKRVLEILSDKETSNRDLIAAARLTAQIDGRFMSAESNDPDLRPDTDSIATELVEAIRRTRQTVQ